MDTWREKPVGGQPGRHRQNSGCARLLGPGRPSTGLRVGWEAVTRKRNSLGETEADAEVILADAVIAAIPLKGKLQADRIG